MQDDLAELKAGGGIRKRPPTPLQPIPAAAPVSEASAFPLAPVNNNQKVVMSPAVEKRALPWGRLALIVGLVVVVAAAGVGAWWFISRRGSSGGGVIATAEQVLPAQHTVVVAYPALSAETKGKLQTLWASSTQPASVASLLKGDPRLLLTDDSSFPFFYVLLPGEVRPYVVVRKTAMTSGLFDETHDGNVVVYQGWYVVHAIDTKPYLTALANGTASVDTVTALTAAPSDASFMRWWLKPEAWQQLRTSVAGRPWAKAPLNEAIVSFGVGSQEKSLTLSGNSPQLSLSPANSADRQQQYQPALLNLIPGDASLIQTGGNLKEALDAWRASGAPLPAERLDRPLVKQFIDQLTVPYIFYYRLGADAVPDVGLVADLTPIPTLTPASLFGDAGVEAALPAWLHLLLDNPPTVDLIFTERIYNETPLKYVNVQGPELALDYAVAGNYLVAASSREGMLKLLDVITQREAVDITQGWRAFVTAWGNMPAGANLSVATLSYPPLRSLLPPGNEAVTIGMTLAGQASGGSTISGQVQY